MPLIDIQSIIHEYGPFNGKIWEFWGRSFKSSFCVHLDRNDQSGTKNNEIWLLGQWQGVLSWIILFIIALYAIDPWWREQICVNVAHPSEKRLKRFSRIEWIYLWLEGIDHLYMIKIEDIMIKISAKWNFSLSLRSLD